jgi:chromosome segregation ATPase/ribosomal protein L40E
MTHSPQSTIETPQSKMNKRSCPQCLATLSLRARLCPQCGIIVPEQGASQPASDPAPAPAAIEPEAAAVPVAPARGYWEQLIARVRRAFAVAGEIRAARAEVESLGRERDRLVARLGETAWGAGVVPAATNAVADQVHRVDREIAAASAKVAVLEAQLAEHDRRVGELEARAMSALEAAAATRKQSEEERDRLAGDVREMERSLEVLGAEAERADVDARAARAEADALGLANLSAEARIQCEAELDDRRLDAERAAADARSRASDLRETLAVRHEALQSSETVVAGARADHERVEAERSTQERNLAQARAALETLAAEGRTRIDGLRAERGELLAQLGWVVAMNRPPYGALEPLYTEIDRLDEQLDAANGRVTTFKAEHAALQTTRVATAVAVISLMIAIFLLAFVVATRR